MKNATCKYCGARIVFVKTQGGRLMPCEPGMVAFAADATARSQFLLPDGRLAKGLAADPCDPTALRGYAPHFGRCAGR